MRNKYIPIVLSFLSVVTPTTAFELLQSKNSADPLICIIQGVQNIPTQLPEKDKKDYMGKMYLTCVGSINPRFDQCIIHGMLSCSYEKNIDKISDCMDEYYKAC